MRSGGTRPAIATKATLLPPPAAAAEAATATAAACRAQPPQPCLFPQRRQQRFRTVPPQASFDDASASASSSSRSSPAAEKDVEASHGTGSSNSNNGFLTPVASTSNGSAAAAAAAAAASSSLSEDLDEEEDDTAEAAAAADYWSDLPNTPEPDMLGARARSASDAGVLRRKGHLKEQDALIDFMRSMHATHSAAEVMAKLDRWVEQHRADPARSRLRRLIPGIGAFFTPLDLTGEEFVFFSSFFCVCLLSLQRSSRS